MRKRATGFIFLFLLASLVACEQTKTVTANEVSKPEFIQVGNKKINIYSNLKDSLSTDWKRENPDFKEIEVSFFSKANVENYFVAPIQISGYQIPFAWDDDLSILKFLLSINDNIEIRKGTEADPYYKGIKIKWEEAPSAFLWIDEQAYKAPVTDWYLIQETDCPGTINFATISFKKQFEVADAINNSIKGVAIMPFNNEFKKITSNKVSMRTDSGALINGKTYDINNDGISDVFIFDEEIDETTYYSRLYLNIDGKWECKYVKLDEVCI